MKLLVLVVVALAVGCVEPHAHMIDPIARTSMFAMYPELYPTQPPYWDTQGVWCGNVQQDTSYSTCGRCGEPPGGQDFSQGGSLGNNIIVKSYTSGALITVQVDGQAWHYGHIKFELCSAQTESDTCFQELRIVSANRPIRDNNRVCIECDNCQDKLVTAQLQLPAGTTCDRCTIRWTYRTSYPGRPGWDYCDNPDATQTFRNCADVRIQ